MDHLGVPIFQETTLWISMGIWKRTAVHGAWGGLRNLSSLDQKWCRSGPWFHPFMLKFACESVIFVGTAHVLQRTSSCVAQIQIYVQYYIITTMFSILDESPLDIPTIPPKIYRHLRFAAPFASSCCNSDFTSSSVCERPETWHGGWARWCPQDS